MRYAIRYMDWSKAVKDDVFTVHTTTLEDGSEGFYAENLRTLGCGKNSTDPQDACERLALAHGQKVMQCYKID